MKSAAESPMSDARENQPLNLTAIAMSERQRAAYIEHCSSCPNSPALDGWTTDAGIIAAGMVITGSSVLRAGWDELMAATTATIRDLTQRTDLLSAGRGIYQRDADLAINLSLAVIAATFVTGAPTLATLELSDLPSYLALTQVVNQSAADLGGTVQGSAAFQQLAATPIEWSTVTADRAAHASYVRNLANVCAPIFRTRAETPFSRACGAALLPAVHEAITEHFTSAMPGVVRADQVLSCEPCGIERLVPALGRIAHALDFNLGNSDADGDEFLIAPTLVALGSLGITAFGAVARARAENGEAGWDRLSTLDPTQLAPEISAARAMSGYPASLLRVDCVAFLRMCVAHNINPTFTRALVVLHVMKYCRLLNGPNGHFLRVAYGNLLCDIPISTQGLRQPLTAPDNVKMLKVLCQTLQLPRMRGQGVALVQAAINGALGDIVVEMLPAVEELPAQLIAAPILLAMPDTRRSSGGWIVPGMAVSGLRLIDLESGAVGVTRVAGHQLLQYRLTFAETATGYDPAVSAGFYAQFPPKIEPALPGNALINRYFRNVTRHINGKDLGWVIERLINVVTIVNLIRTKLPGSAIGRALTKEFPAIFACAEAAGDMETSGQGKTSFCREIARMAVQGIREMRATRQAGDVKQRESAHDLVHHGMMLLDEFRIAERSDGDTWCDREGLCTLLIGGTVPIGQVGKNSAPSSLRFDPFFIGKYYHLPYDLQLRTVPIRLGHFTDQTRTSEADAETINSDALAVLLRLSALVYIARERVTDRLRSAPLGPTDLRFRFPGHLGIYCELFGRESMSDFLDGIVALRTAAIAVCSEAGRSGKLTANGQGDPLNPGLLLSVVPENDLWMMHRVWAQTHTAPTMALTEILRAGASANNLHGEGTLDRLVQSYRVTIPEAVARFIAALGKPIEAGNGWVLRLVNERHPTANRQRPRILLDPPPGEVPPGGPVADLHATMHGAGSQQSRPVSASVTRTISSSNTPVTGNR